MTVFIIVDFTGFPIRAFSTLKAAQFYAKSLRGEPGEYRIIDLAVD